MANGAGKPEYGNWVSGQSIIILLTLTVISAASAASAYFGAWYVPFLLIIGIILTLLTLFFLALLIYYLAARYVLSYDGGNVQGQLLDLLISYIPEKQYGNVLDIGCGSGALTIRLAKKFTQARVTGVDCWRAGRGYTAEQCRENARLAFAEDNTVFVQGSAAQLPFADGTFDLVVSNLAFHKIKGAKDKWSAVAEALRVLRTGGVFAFQDKFLIKSFYGEKERLEKNMGSFGVMEARFIDTSHEEFMPRFLKIRFALGCIGIFRGAKK